MTPVFERPRDLAERAGARWTPLTSSTNWPAWTSSTDHVAHKPEPTTRGRSVVQAVNPRFQFTDPPLQRSLPMTLAFAATADVAHRGPDRPQHGRGQPGHAASAISPRGRRGMVQVSLHEHPLTASAALVWSLDLPNTLQQMLVETADKLDGARPAGRTDPNRPDAKSSRDVSYKGVAAPRLGTLCQRSSTPGLCTDV